MPSNSGRNAVKSSNFWRFAAWKMLRNDKVTGKDGLIYAKKF